MDRPSLPAAGVENPDATAAIVSEPAGDEPRRHRWLVFGIVSIALLMASIDQTIVATALNAIQRDLGAQLNWSGWTITIYALGQIIAMPLAGRLGDQFGRKRIFIGAAVLFTVASLACSLADNIYLLVVCRAFQALGGGAFMPTATGIVAEQFGRNRDRAVGMFTSIFPIGGILGHGAAVLGFGALVPLYAESRYGIQPLQAGTLLTARAVGMICVAGLAVFALRRTGYRSPMIGGILMVAGGMSIMALAPHGMTPYAWLAAAAGVTGIGMGLSIPASNNASLQLAPDQISAIAGLRGMFRQSGGIIAVSVTTTVLSHSANAGVAQAHTFVVFAALLVLIVPFTLMVPDHRGSW